ncbi:DUF1501 domain-containing protein [Mesorhizobium sp. BAC0120]|uniref:DUF1501 domain-containing protein n=1 Tax=Mesorhizobium sp. BAC0120 TaxID=3090670 RepID=UPI00298C02D1|nr:DUF1501 domain-containing protein [Mesorhizobium sp. BAC0120]MDW6026322.1 DUF1501 domain-containing protein [Mesorhizobium sp. BAC0120]
MIHRRQFLRFAALGAGAMLVSPGIVFANVETERRFVFIIQRGAADGLNTVIPYNDSAYRTLRSELAIDPSTALKLDGTFALHPSLGEISRLYTEKQALFVHAVASPYRERSHFDGQNVLETGGSGPYQVKDGWLNRLVGLLPKSRAEAIAFAPTIPLALRGPAEVTSYAPSELPEAPDDLLMRVGHLYEADAKLHPLWSAAMEARGLADRAQAQRDPASIGRTAASFLGRADGPRIAMIETGGWDTHSAQNNRLANQLKALDTMVGALRDGLGDVWQQTTVLVATEFGRTVAANGTGGTDHGTASAAIVLGGAVRGGRVLTDWPGLDQRSLYEGRDLKPTLDLDQLIAAVAAESLRLDPELAMRTLFPGRPSSQFFHGLIG